VSRFVACYINVRLTNRLFSGRPQLFIHYCRSDPPYLEAVFSSFNLTTAEVLTWPV